MAIAMAVVAVVGTALTIAGQMQQAQAARAQGEAQQVASDYSARVLDQQAGQTRAAAQQSAINQGMQTEYTLSRARAAAAASGGGASDPTAEDIYGQIAARGGYNALAELYTGEEKALGLGNQAQLDEFTGQQQALAGAAKEQAGYLTAAGTALQSASSLYGKYGGGAGAGAGASA